MIISHVFSSRFPVVWSMATDSQRWQKRPFPNVTVSRILMPTFSFEMEVDIQLFSSKKRSLSLEEVFFLLFFFSTSSFSFSLTIMFARKREMSHPKLFADRSEAIKIGEVFANVRFVSSFKSARQHSTLRTFENHSCAAGSRTSLASRVLPRMETETLPSRDESNSFPSSFKSIRRVSFIPPHVRTKYVNA